MGSLSQGDHVFFLIRTLKFAQIIIYLRSELWIPIYEVPEPSLTSYFTAMREKGYVIVALEQVCASLFTSQTNRQTGRKRERESLSFLLKTRDSHNILNFQFPEKTVLVLGKVFISTLHPLSSLSFQSNPNLFLFQEKEGVPVDILQNVDFCVEIPQFGVTRSLNVHVSGALCVWEYTKQWHSKLAVTE